MSKALRLLYDARDAMAATIFGDNAIACKAGCSHCCSHAVFVSMAEAKMIHGALGSEYKDIARPTWERQCRIFGKATAKAYRQPCVFLDDLGKCSIYGNRPFMCRWYNSKDAGNCERNEPVMQAHAPWDKMYMRLAQIAWAQADHGQNLSHSNINESSTHVFLPAAMLHVAFNHWSGRMPEIYVNRRSSVTRS